MAFATVTEIQQHYADAINRLGNSNPSAVLELKHEEREAISEFRLRQVTERERNVWMREAFQKYPLARSFPQLIEGGTEEAVEQSAKSVHEQLEEAFSEHQRQREMQKLWERHQNSPNGEDSEPAV